MKDDIFLCMFSFRQPLFLGVKSFRQSETVFKIFSAVLPITVKLVNFASSICEINLATTGVRSSCKNGQNMLTCNVPLHQYRKAIIGTLLTRDRMLFLIWQREDTCTVPTTLKHRHRTAHALLRKADLIFMKKGSCYLGWTP